MYFFEVHLAPEFGPDDACVVSAKLEMAVKKNRAEIWKGWWPGISTLLEESEKDALAQKIVIRGRSFDEAFPAFEGGKVTLKTTMLTDLKSETEVQKLLIDPVVK